MLIGVRGLLMLLCAKQRVESVHLALTSVSPVICDNQCASSFQGTKWVERLKPSALAVPALAIQGIEGVFAIAIAGRMD
jgi:hypothetical protein